MKTTNKEKIAKAKLLQTLIEKRKQLEDQEAELKQYFKTEIKDGFLEAGNVIILIEECQRTSIDRELLTEKIGAEKVKQFEKVTTYDKVTVKAA